MNAGAPSATAKRYVISIGLPMAAASLRASDGVATAGALSLPREQTAVTAAIASTGNKYQGLRRMRRMILAIRVRVSRADRASLRARASAAR